MGPRGRRRAGTKRGQSFPSFPPLRALLGPQPSWKSPTLLTALPLIPPWPTPTFTRAPGTRTKRDSATLAGRSTPPGPPGPRLRSKGVSGDVAATASPTQGKRCFSGRRSRRLHDLGNASLLPGLPVPVRRRSLGPLPERDDPSASAAPRARGSADVAARAGGPRRHRESRGGRGGVPCAFTAPGPAALPGASRDSSSAVPPAPRPGEGEPAGARHQARPARREHSRVLRTARGIGRGACGRGRGA